MTGIMTLEELQVAFAILVERNGGEVTLSLREIMDFPRDADIQVRRELHQPDVFRVRVVRPPSIIQGEVVEDARPRAELDVWAPRA